MLRRSWLTHGAVLIVAVAAIAIAFTFSDDSEGTATK
jgi:hypothetical protein